MKGNKVAVARVEITGRHFDLKAAFGSKRVSPAFPNFEKPSKAYSLFDSLGCVETIHRLPKTIGSTRLLFTKLRRSPNQSELNFRASLNLALNLPLESARNFCLLRSSKMFTFATKRFEGDIRFRIFDNEQPPHPCFRCGRLGQLVKVGRRRLPPRLEKKTLSKEVSEVRRPVHGHPPQPELRGPHQLGLPHRNKPR